MGACFCTGACMRGGTCSAFPHGRTQPEHQPISTGWLCPKCNKGNAPWASKCGHCESEKEKVTLSEFVDMWFPDLK